MADLELQLRLSADGSGLVGTLRTATGEVQKFRTESEKANKTTGASADEIGKAVKAYDLLFDTIGQVVSGLTRLVKAEIDYADQVGTTAQRLGVSTELLSGLGAAARRNSSDFDAVVSGIDSIGEAAIRAGMRGVAGSKQYSAAFAALQVDVRDAAGSIKPAQVLIDEVAASLSRLPDGALKARLSTQLLGSAGKELSGTLEELAKTGLQGVIDKAHETGEVITSEAAARAKAFKDGMQALNTTVSAFASSVGQDVLPTLLTLAGMFTENAGGAQKMRGESGLLRTTVEGLGLGVVVTTETFKVLFTMLYGGIDVLIGITSAAARAVVGIGFAAAAAQAFQSGQLAAASTFADQAKNQFTTGWDEIATSATRAWGAITSAGADADARIAEYNQRIQDGYKGTAAAAGGASEAAAASANASTLAAAQAAAAAEAQRRYEEALRNGDKAERERAKAALDYQKAIVDVASALSQQRGELSPLDAATEAYKQRVTEAHLQVAEWAKAGVTGGEVQAYLRGEIELAQAALERETASIAKSGDTLGNYLKQVADQRALAGMTERQRAMAKAVADVTKEYRTNAAAGYVMADSLEDVQAGAAAAAGGLFDFEQGAAEMEGILSQFGEITAFDKLRGDIEKVGAALEEALAKGSDTEGIERMKRALGDLNRQMEQRNLTLMQQGVSSLQTFAKEGTAAYTALGIAQDILAYKSAIAAIANQGSGDPYTAFARIAAMIGLMASIGIRVGGHGGGFTDSAAQRQATQGTGTVLGAPDAKSESIANAVEITAEATSELVGLNRGMLDALRAIQEGIGGAAAQIARGAADVEFGQFDPGTMLNARNGAAMGAAIGSVIPVIGTVVGAVLGAVIGKFLGGSSKLTDQGISIGGGSLDDLTFGAYQEHQTRSWRFGSRRTSTQTADLPDDVATQFGLIMDSIVDTVREGALALGLMPDEIERALDAYRLEAIKISLKGLSAEEQQKELEAVFSSIFDGLAGSVVPFIGQFQRVGEGLGETLVRVATGVQVTQEAARQLGFYLEVKTPEQYAQASEALIGLVGGLDEMIAGMSSFVGAFASDGQKLQISFDALTSAFGAVGLKLPETEAGMWDLMRSLDGTTESGRAQIATLIRLSDASSEYYALVEKVVQANLDYISQVSALQTELGQGGGYNGSLAEIQGWARNAENSLNEAARAAGRMGAAEEDLALVREVAQQRYDQLIARLMNEARDIAAQLDYTHSTDTIDSLNAAIEAMGGSANDAASTIGDAVNTIRDQLGLLLGDLSPFNDRQKLEMARQGLIEGNVTQEQFLQIAQRLFGATSRYREEFEFAQQYPGAVDGGTNIAGGRTPGSAVGDGRSLEELISARDALLEAQRGELANNLASRIAELAYARDISFEEVAEQLGFNLEQLGADLNMDSAALQEYLQGLSDRFASADFSAVGDLITGAIHDSRDAIVRAIQGASFIGDADKLPSYDVGTARVSGDQVARIHDGEMILPASIAEIVRSADGNDATVAELVEVRAELRAARELLTEIARQTSRGADAALQTAAATADLVDETGELRREVGPGGRGRPLSTPLVR